jgi:hypothetical protein
VWLFYKRAKKLEDERPDSQSLGGKSFYWEIVHKNHLETIQAR